MKMSDYAKMLGRKGGVARGRRLSPERRKEIARAGGKARSESFALARRIEENFRYLKAIEELSKSS